MPVKMCLAAFGSCEDDEASTFKVQKTLKGLLRGSSGHGTPEVSPKSGFVGGKWGDCLAWAVIYEHQNLGRQVRFLGLRRLGPRQGLQRASLSLRGQAGMMYWSFAGRTPLFAVINGTVRSKLKGVIHEQSAATCPRLCLPLLELRSRNPDWEHNPSYQLLS